MDPKIEAEIMEMLKAGMSPMAIAQEMGLSIQTIRNVKKALDPEAQASIPSATTGVNEVLVGEEYERGDQIPVILEKHSISRAKLYQILAKFSIPARRVENANARERAMEEAVSLYKQGVVIRQITADTGIHQPTLHAELARRSIPLRRPRGHTT